ncbi:MAG TPA: CDP-alcohol phosphatidyltransferase family protein [Candidatus Limnocylindria bacterium]|nr:CDP-alcohol phosphatidyltransferase family protein [Candidatus Limnocylindria bacterium]
MSSILPEGARAGGRGGLAPIARALHGAGVSANAVTVAGLLLTIAGAALLALAMPVPALVVLLAGALADTLDGQIARAAGGGTTLGAFLDSTFDRLSDAAFAVAAIALGASRADAFLLWAGIIALVAGFLVPYIRAKAESLGLTASVGLAPREARLALLVLGVAAWAATGTLQLFAAAVAVVAFLSSITTIQRIVHVARSLNT